MFKLFAGLILLAAVYGMYALWQEWRERKDRALRDARRRKRYHENASYDFISRWLFAHRRRKRLTHQQRPPVTIIERERTPD
ncbi:MAG: hypothetical protein V4808_11010 [Pseudomonadota bacterium]